MPKQLNAGQVTQALQRAFGFKGRYEPMLDEVIVPVYVISDPSPAQVTRLAGGTVFNSQTAVTSEGNFSQLFNPARSGVLVNVTSGTILGDVKAEMAIRLGGLSDTPAPTLLSPGSIFRDRRNSGNPLAQIRRDDTGAGLSSGDILAKLVVDGALTQTASWVAEAADPRQPLAVLAPGQGVTVQPIDQGLTIIFNVNFKWLEVPITQVNPAAGIP